MPKAINLRTLTNTQIEILDGLVTRALYEWNELNYEQQRNSSELAGYNPGVQLQTIKRWITFNS